jgi:hypothetical protein
MALAAEEYLAELKMAVMATGTLVEVAFHQTTRSLSERTTLKVKIW